MLVKVTKNVWNTAPRRLVINFMIPLATGGFFHYLLIEKHVYSIAPLTLIFYGLACVNASNISIGDVRYLGITMIALGLLSTWFLGYGLLFWVLGFMVATFYTERMYLNTRESNQLTFKLYT